MRGMALIGSTLHFSYSEMLEMDISVFMDFVDYANEIVEKQG
jgi:hypothetical protein